MNGLAGSVDAVRAARDALSTEQLISLAAAGKREAMRVLMSTRSSAVTARTRAANHLKALIVSAPETLRAELRGKASDAQISYGTNLRSRPSQSTGHRMTVTALRSAASRILTLRAEADDLEREITSSSPRPGRSCSPCPASAPSAPPRS